MKKIIASLTIIQLLTASMSLQAMQVNSDSNGPSMQSIIAGAGVLCGLYTTIKFSKRYFALSKEKERSDKLTDNLKTTTKNITQLSKIRELAASREQNLKPKIKKAITSLKIPNSPCKKELEGCLEQFKSSHLKKVFKKDNKKRVKQAAVNEGFKHAVTFVNLVNKTKQEQDEAQAHCKKQLATHKKYMEEQDRQFKKLPICVQKNPGKFALLGLGFTGACMYYLGKK
jgi:hypothetical protein